MPLGTEVGLGAGHIVLDGDSTPPERSTAAPHFSANFALVRTPISAAAELFCFARRTDHRQCCQLSLTVAPANNACRSVRQICDCVGPTVAHLSYWGWLSNLTTLVYNTFTVTQWCVTWPRYVTWLVGGRFDPEKNKQSRSIGLFALLHPPSKRSRTLNNSRSGPFVYVWQCRVHSCWFIALCLQKVISGQRISKHFLQIIRSLMPTGCSPLKR